MSAESLTVATSVTHQCLGASMGPFRVNLVGSIAKKRMRILDTLKNRARAYLQRIVLPEGEDPRVIEAAARVAAEGYAKPALLGRADAIRAAAARLGSKLDGVEILDPA